MIHLDNLTLTAVPGLLVGHAHDLEAMTGCTVVLCPQGAVAGVDQRGGAPGTRETDLLRPLHLVERVHAVLLAGGSAFGLDAAGGVMRFLEAQGVGYETGVAKVPIVPAAVLFDLSVGRADVRPDAAMGFLACQQASSAPVAEGNLGAGAGASVGKILGLARAMKAGLGSAALHLPGGLVIAALAAVNALGDVVEPQSGRILAGARLASAPARGAFANTLEVFRAIGAGTMGSIIGGNTTLGVVATNARLNKEQVNKVAQMAQDGLARAVRPAHTLLDGDTIFALSTGELAADVNIVGSLAADVFATAVVRAVLTAATAGGLPGAAEIGSLNE